MGSPRLGVVLRVFDLVFRNDVRVLVEDEETRRARGETGKRRRRHSATDDARGTAVERTDELSLFERRHG